MNIDRTRHRIPWAIDWEAAVDPKALHLVDVWGGLEQSVGD